MTSPYTIGQQLQPKTSHPWYVMKYDEHFIDHPVTVGYATRAEAEQVKRDLEREAGYTS